MSTVDRVRESAARMMDVARRHGAHPAAGIDEIQRMFEPLLADPVELFASGIQTSARTSSATFSTLYYDTLLRIVMSKLPAGFEEKVHDHGNVNHIMVARGSVHYRQFRLRQEDVHLPGRAVLEELVDARLGAGDIGLILPPPNDIHALEVLEDDTYLVTAMFSPSADTRRFYDPETGTYVEQSNA